MKSKTNEKTSKEKNINNEKPGAGGRQTAKIRRTLNYSIKEGAATAAMDGFGSSYISPFIIAMQASNTLIGLLTSLPTLFASLAQLKTLSLVEKIKSRKKLVTKTVLLQALMWLPLLAIPFLFQEQLKSIGALLAIIIFTILAALGSLGAPAWASWMGDLVSAKKRGRYFGTRNFVAGSIALVTMLLAGVFLNIFPQISKNTIFIAFAILFATAAFARLISYFFLSKKYEPKLIIDKQYYFTFWDFIKKMRHNNFGRFTIYTALISATANIAAPFFAVYMLRNLEYTYLTFTLVRIAGSITSILAMPLWGRISDKTGNIKTLKICGFLLPILPLLWLISPNPIFILAINALGGFIWAGHGLSVSNFIYDSTTQQRRPIAIAYLNVLAGIGVFIGALTGGILATHIQTNLINSIFLIFIISGITRLLTIALLFPKVQEVREVKPKPLLQIARSETHGIIKDLICGIQIGSSKIRQLRWKNWTIKRDTSLLGKIKTTFPNFFPPLQENSENPENLENNDSKNNKTKKHTKNTSDAFKLTN